MKQLFYIITIVLSVKSVCFSQYNISVTINGLQNRNVFLAYHYGDKTYITDTARLDDKGRGVFTGSKPLKEGIYLVVLPSKIYFELIMDSHQSFSIETDTSSDMRELIKKLKVNRSPINTLFRDYQMFMFEKTKEAHFLKVTSYDRSETEKKRDEANEKLIKLNQQIKDYQNKILKKHPNTMLAKLIKGFEEPQVPEIGSIAGNRTVDSLFRYNYYKDNYFNNIDFTDTRLLRSPIYHNRLVRFFDNVVSPFHDSIISASVRLLDITEINTDFFQYTLQYIFNRFSQSKIMGHENVTVYLANNYYLNGKAEWVESSFIEKLKERISKIEPNMVGSPAPRLDKAQTLDGMFYPLHSTGAKYTVLFFWEPNCGHCKKEIPQLLEIFDKYYSKGLAVYAFCTQNNRDEWEKAIEDYNIHNWINVYDPFYFTRFRDIYDIYTTPTLYLLDSKFKIIAKRVTIEVLGEIIKGEFGE